MDHTQTFNSSLGKQIKSLKQRWLPMEDNLKILDVDYLSNHIYDDT